MDGQIPPVFNRTSSPPVPSGAAAAKGVDSQTLADSLGLKERYVREWLSSMVTGEIIDAAEEKGKYYVPKVSHINFA